MPSGGCTVTPGKILAPAEKVNNAKLNQLGQPVVRVDQGAISERELDSSAVRNIVSQMGGNLFCNGNFAYWPTPDDTGGGPDVPITGLSPISTRKHEYTGPARWVIPNDANRSVSRQKFAPGQTEVPGAPLYFTRWQQTAPVASTINPAYLGQRLELVGSMSGRTFTFTIWVRSNVGLNVIPSLRQMFGDPGFGASADVVVNQTAITLSANIWTKIKSTWTLPSVAGKTIVEGNAPNNPGSFTEFRLVLPQGIVFTIDYAQAQLVEGDQELAFDTRVSSIDYLEAQRFRQFVGIMLSDNLSTHGNPSVNLPVKPRGGGLGLGPGHLLLIFGSGTGGTVGADGTCLGHIIQLTPHSAIVQARIFVDVELHAPA